MRLIGLDPSLVQTGWGIIDVQGRDLSFVASGAIRTRSGHPMAERLGVSSMMNLGRVLALHEPDEAALEQVFRQSQSTLRHWRSDRPVVAVFVAVARRRLPVHEYAATTVKQAVTGHGHASKEQVAALVRMQLPRSTAKTHDASDAPRRCYLPRQPCADAGSHHPGRGVGHDRQAPWPAGLVRRGLGR